MKHCCDINLKNETVLCLFHFPFCFLPFQTCLNRSKKKFCTKKKELFLILLSFKAEKKLLVWKKSKKTFKIDDNHKILTFFRLSSRKEKSKKFPKEERKNVCGYLRCLLFWLWMRRALHKVCAAGFMAILNAEILQNKMKFCLKFAWVFRSWRNNHGTAVHHREERSAWTQNVNF